MGRRFQPDGSFSMQRTKLDALNVANDMRRRGFRAIVRKTTKSERSYEGLSQFKWIAIRGGKKKRR